MTTTDHSQTARKQEPVKALDSDLKESFQQAQADIGSFLNTGQRTANQSRRVLDEAQRRQAHALIESPNFGDRTGDGSRQWRGLGREQDRLRTGRHDVKVDEVAGRCTGKTNGSLTRRDDRLPVSGINEPVAGRRR